MYVCKARLADGSYALIGENNVVPLPAIAHSGGMPPGALQALWKTQDGIPERIASMEDNALCAIIVEYSITETTLTFTQEVQ